MSSSTNLRLSKDGSEDILRGYEQFSFLTGTTLPDPNANNLDFLSKTASYLKENANETLTITACSRENEDASLGLKRAESLRDALIKLGIDATRINTAACVSSKDLHTSAVFNLSRSNTTNTVAVKNTEKKDSYLNFDISDENFTFNSAVFQPKQDFINKVSQLTTYIASHPKISVSITGHTDDVGNDAYNVRLGQQRSEAVKAYLKKSGLKININTTSQGEKTPIASNDSEEGRAQNRRVNCKVNQ
jgi:outer membrane protein OmpA-like peptidoglycan-associated protein